MAIQRRARKLTCRKGDRRFTVVVVGNDDHDSHAGRSFEEAMERATPDRGSQVRVYVTCARDAGEARLPSNYQWGQLVRMFKKK